MDKIMEMTKEKEKAKAKAKCLLEILSISRLLGLTKNPKVKLIVFGRPNWLGY